jgi:hypothetical protein
MAISPRDNGSTVRVATTEHVDLDAPLVAIDGVTLGNSEKVLVKDQNDPAENGVYRTRRGKLSRPLKNEIVAGMVLTVQEGAQNGDKLFILTTDNPITVYKTGLTFEELNAGTATGGSVYGAPSIVFGDEAGDSRNVIIAVRDADGQNLPQSTLLKVFVTSSPTPDPESVLGQGTGAELYGVPSNVLLNIHSGSIDVLTYPSGQVQLILRPVPYEAEAVLYLNVVLPDGSIHTSQALAFNGAVVETPQITSAVSNDPEEITFYGSGFSTYPDLVFEMSAQGQYTGFNLNESHASYWSDTEVTFNYADMGDHTIFATALYSGDGGFYQNFDHDDVYVAAAPQGSVNITNVSVPEYGSVTVEGSGFDAVEYLVLIGDGEELGYDRGGWSGGFRPEWTDELIQLVNANPPIVNLERVELRDASQNVLAFIEGSWQLSEEQVAPPNPVTTSISATGNPGEIQLNGYGYLENGTGTPVVSVEMLDTTEQVNVTVQSENFTTFTDTMIVFTIPQMSGLYAWIATVMYNNGVNGSMYVADPAVLLP